MPKRDFLTRKKFISLEVFGLYLVYRGGCRLPQYYVFFYIMCEGQGYRSKFKVIGCRNMTFDLKKIIFLEVHAHQNV